jgi:4-amino-4-deoxy-L-arabinose transferase-like glycosyltransferase
MILLVLQALVVGYVPGALMMRLPGRSQAVRAALPFDERLFWSILLSVVWSLSVVLGLAAMGRYSFPHLVLTTTIAAALVVVTIRGRLRFGAPATRPSWTMAIPIALVAIGVWLYFPPSEYIIGGKDPGTYINEGVQIAQRGEIVVHDPDVAGVPAQFRDLFFPSHHQDTYYGLRFMGFFIQDPSDGTVVGQFQHGYPASIALGYALNGLTGARQTIGLWTMLSLLAVYFTGRYFFGWAAAGAAALLLAVNVVDVWFGRYPNSEMAMQALLFAALLAAGRARDDGRRFFGAVAGVLLGVSLFVRYEILIAFAAFAAAAVLVPAGGRRFGWPFRAAIVVIGAAGFWYLLVPMRAYFAYPLDFARQRGGWLLAAAGLTAAVAAHRLLRRPSWAARVHRWLPRVLAAGVVGLAVYAYFFRQAAGRTALGDAMAFRTFGWYLTPWVLALAVAGFAAFVLTRFWSAPAFVLTLTVFSVFFFYKTRIVAEHFWTARRFLGVTLPSAMLFAATIVEEGANGTLAARLLGRVPAETAAPPLPAVLAALAGAAFWRASAPVEHHVEYAGLIPRLEHLAQQIGDQDLVLVESRNAGSDLHTFAMPLAYIYARHVLVLDSPAPPRDPFEAFVTWALTRYRTVYFLGGGGTDLLTRGLTAEPVSSDRFQVAEYDAPMNAYPTGVRHKEFEYGLYRLLPVAQRPSPVIDLQIGGLDDLNVVRFHARERRGDTGLVFRWSGAQSFVVLTGLSASASEVTIWMSSGGRPPQAPAPVVEVALDDTVLGSATPVDPVQPYRFAIPPDLARRLAARADPVRLRLRVPTWNPQALLGVNDTRDLGVIVTRVEVR